MESQLRDHYQLKNQLGRDHMKLMLLYATDKG